MTSIIAPEARISATAKIGEFCRIHPRVVIEDDVEIGDYCLLGHPSPRADGSPLVIRSGSVIRSHSVFYEGSSFGPGLATGHHVTVREGTLAGPGLQLGSLSDARSASASAQAPPYCAAKMLLLTSRHKGSRWSRCQAQ